MSQQTIGKSLREAREAIPASLYQASRETKIRADFLDCMEKDDFHFVSGGPYVKGMLRAYGKWLRLDDRQLTEIFQRCEQVLPEPSVSEVVREPARIPPRKRPHWMMAALSAGGILLILSLVGVMRPAQDTAAPPSTPREVRPSPAAAARSGVARSAQPPAASEQFPADLVKVTLTVIGEKSWVEAYADLPDGGRQLVYRGILAGGESKSLEGKDRVRAVIGNLGAVSINHNGRDLGVPGQPGQVGKFVFDRQAATPAPQ